MTAVGTAGAGAIASPRLSVETLRGALLWLMGLAGAFVFIEPSPYEVVGAVSIFLFGLTGLTVGRALLPLALLLVLENVGYAIGMVQVSDDPKAITWVFISAYLAVTAVFYAAALRNNTEARLRLLLRGYLVGALIASVVGVAGYFHLFGSLSEVFLRYDRARGTFNDPNVLGAFLVLPAIMVFQRILVGRAAEVIRSGVLLLVMLAGLLLTFSRAAWGQFAFCAMVVMVLSFMSTRSPSQRMRIVLITLLGILLVAVFIGALLSIPQVANLFTQRASLDQSYDVGHFGRFGRYILGAELGLDRPLGIGPLQFALFFGEDSHNSYLNSFMSGGWLSGCTYVTLTLVTLVNATRFLRAATPWQSTYQVVYAAYLGVAAESAIIDSDHWRHYFLILGALWGLMAASRPYMAVKPATAGAHSR